MMPLGRALLAAPRLRNAYGEGDDAPLACDVSVCTPPPPPLAGVSFLAYSGDGGKSLLLIHDHQC